MIARNGRQLRLSFEGLVFAVLMSTACSADTISNIIAVPGGELDNAGQVLTRTSSGWALYQNGVTTPVLNPSSGKQIQAANAVISPGGVIAYDYGINADANVLLNGKNYDAGAPTFGSILGNGPYSTASAVNDSGTVVGQSHALERWNQAFVSSLGSSGTYTATAMGANGGTISGATAVNNAGTVVGWTDVPGQWRNQAFVGSTSNVIGTLGGINSHATGINNEGMVIGWSTVANGWTPPTNPQNYSDPEPTHAFLYGLDGKMHDLGLLPGYQDSYANSINSHGQIVGYAANFSQAISQGSTDPTRAILFEDGKVIDLNSLLPANSGWILDTAWQINDSDQISGYGTLNGTSESFLLSLSTNSVEPVPEPTTLVLFGAMAAAGVVRTARQRKR